jgi:hypothetical protein
MKHTLFYFTLVLLCLGHTRLYAEGTKQLRPTSGSYGYIQINDADRTFATYAASPEERLHIHVSSVKEKIYFGFGKIWNTENLSSHKVATDVYYRIKNEKGVVVSGPALIPSAGQGFIDTYTKVVNGPTKINAAGYNALVYTPVDTGDFYIEFNQGSGTVSSAPSGKRRVFEMFDITVIDETVPASPVVKNGRVWSKNWDINTNAASNPFTGTLFVYSNDGVVTSVGFNGMQPYAFTISCNSTGCVNTGNPDSDRKSRAGNATYPSYKIFLNDPDQKVYPSGVIGTLNTSLTLTGCAPHYCINLNTDAPGFVDFVVELNGIPGYQPNSRDLIFGMEVNTGTTCIPWDGRDGKGNLIDQNLNFEIQAEYKFGLTNLPMFDVENFNNGFKVASVRPLVIVPKLFWDDSQLGGTTNLTGCTATGGCHPWPSANFGDQRTINTWWYVNVQRDTIYTVSIPKPSPVINGLSLICDTSVLQIYATNEVPGNSYVWSIKRGTISGSSTGHQVSVKQAAGKDTLIVKESNPVGCFEDTIFLFTYPTPDPAMSGDMSACDVNTVDVYSVDPVPMNSYSWVVTGGVILSGEAASTMQVKWTQTGKQTVTVTERNPNNCSDTDSREVTVHPKPSTSTIKH